MKFLSWFLSIAALIPAGCKTTDSSRNQLKDGTSAGPVQEVPKNISFSADAACQALRSDGIPHQAVSDQITWLCDRDGFKDLKKRIALSSGKVASFEYFAENEKTLYYGGASSFRVPMSKLDGMNRLFCENFDEFKRRFDGHGFENVKSIVISPIREGLCEYSQKAYPQFGYNADFDATVSYGKFDELGLNWRVESMTEPKEGSTIKQYRVLSISWEEDGIVYATYLLRTKVDITNLLMWKVRPKMMSNVTSVISGFESYIQTAGQ